jgi:putative transcriptional regulator
MVEMREREFQKLLESVKQAGQIKKGRMKPSRVAKFTAPDIKAIRRDLAVSQGQFARMIGVSVTTLQNWEQGRRQPRGPARALLKVASRSPRAVLEALHG